MPLRRVNARYVIATSSKVDLKGVDEKVLDKVSQDGYFEKDKKSQKEKSEEAFFKQGQKPEVTRLPSPAPGSSVPRLKPAKKLIPRKPWLRAMRTWQFAPYSAVHYERELQQFLANQPKQQKKEIAASRAEDQKAVDKPLLQNIKKVPMLLDYLHTSFSLRNGDKPHEMKF